MNFLINIFNGHIPIFVLILSILLISGIYLMVLLRFRKIVQGTNEKIITIATQSSKVQALEKKLTISHILNTALINAIQIKSSIEFCSLLLNNCTHKSSVLSNASIDNNLHEEIKKAIIAINALEEKRAFLELKIQEGYQTLNEKNINQEIEVFSDYTKTLANEMQMELETIEKIKTDILKVNTFLDTILLKVTS